MKKLLVGGVVLGILCGGGTVSAEEINTVEQEQIFEGIPVEPQDLMNDFTDNSVESVDKRLRSSNRASIYRGSAAMWIRDTVDFSYSKGKITNSSGYQEEGYVFPNIARAKGITKIESTSTYHKWRGKKSAGAGTVTPWGDVTVYSKDYTDYITVKGDGTAKFN